MKYLLTVLLVLCTTLLFSQTYNSGPTVTVRKASAAGHVPISEANGFYSSRPLDSLTANNYGDKVLFVHQSAGTDSTAERGNRFKPFQNIYTARDSANAGDIIWVLAGSHFTVTDTADGGDRLRVTGDQEWTSLMKDSVTYYFEPETSITNSIAATAYPIFFDTSGVWTEVYGHGVFETTNSVVTMAVINNEDTHLVLQADKIISNSGNTGWGRGICASEWEYIKIDAKEYYVTNSREFHAWYPVNGDTCIGADYIVNIDYLNVRQSDQLFGFARGLYTDVKIAFNINVADIENNYYSAFYLAGIKNTLSLNINTLNLRTGSSANTQFLGYGTDNKQDSMNVTTININSGVTTTSLIFIDNTDIGANKWGSSLRITGNITHAGDSTGNAALIALRNNTDTTLTVSIDGVFNGINVPIIKTIGTFNSRVNVSGIYTTWDESPIIELKHTLPRMRLINSFFDNKSGTIPPIRSSVANTIEVHNAGYQANGILDGDITIVNLPTY